jgi:class 3 adenylate cyclase
LLCDYDGAASGSTRDCGVITMRLDPTSVRECAYGFCDIRQFTDTVECLQDQVMLFTNSVAEILHQACHCNRGEPNANIGDAFLIVWRPKVP